MGAILFYAPFSQRSRDTESLMVSFKGQGFDVILLNMSEGLQIRDFLKEYGIQTFNYSAQSRFSWVRHFKNVIFLIRMCWTKKVTVVYSHLEAANFIAAIAQFFIKAKVYICRHHADQYRLLGLDTDLSYRITYTLARRLIVFSEATRRYMIENEGINPKRVRVIRLAYDFSFYPQILDINVQKLRLARGECIGLITVGSLTALKRPDLSILVLKRLIDAGLNARLIFLGQGEMISELLAIGKQFGLSEKIEFPGYVANVLEYMASSTFLLHPSCSESSCVAVKEAGLAGLPVLVCNNVGDFNEYIVDGINGFVISKDNFVEEAANVVMFNHKKTEYLQKMNERLKLDVHRMFGIENVIQQYTSLNQLH